MVFCRAIRSTLVMMLTWKQPTLLSINNRQHRLRTIQYRRRPHRVRPANKVIRTTHQPQWQSTNNNQYNSNSNARIGMTQWIWKCCRYDAKQRRPNCGKLALVQAVEVVALNSKINGLRQVNLRICADAVRAKTGNDRYDMEDVVCRPSLMREFWRRMRQVVHVRHVVMMIQVSGIFCVNGWNLWNLENLLKTLLVRYV